MGRGSRPTHGKSTTDEEETRWFWRIRPTHFKRPSPTLRHRPFSSTTRRHVSTSLNRAAEFPLFIRECRARWAMLDEPIPPLDPERVARAQHGRPTRAASTALRRRVGPCHCRHRTILKLRSVSASSARGSSAPFISESLRRAICPAGGEVIAVTSATEANVRGFAAAPHPHWFTDYHKMYEMPELDMIVLGLLTTCTAMPPCRPRPPASMSSAKKPLCLNLAEADRMIDACRPARVKLMYAEGSASRRNTSGSSARR